MFREPQHEALPRFQGTHLGLILSLSKDAAAMPAVRPNVQGGRAHAENVHPPISPFPARADRATIGL